MICSKCRSAEGEFWNDTIDPATGQKNLFYLCLGCQKDFCRLTEGFLGVRE